MERPSHHRHSISSYFVHCLLDAAAKLGIDQQQLLREAGLKAEFIAHSQFRVTPKQLSQIILGVWQRGDDEFMGLASQPCRHGVFALMAKLVIHSPDLRRVYRHSNRFFELTNNAIKLQLHEHPNVARQELILAAPELDPQHTLTEFLMMIWHRFPSWLVGRPIPLQRIGFRHSCPAHHQEYQLMFGCPVLYNQPSNFFEFDPALLQLPVHQTPQTLSTYLQRAPLDWLQQQVYYPNFTRRVIDCLQNSTQLSTISMESVASELHLTPRTLRRKLTIEGTSFRTLKDNISRDTAIHLLSQRNLSITQIARQIGFSEPAAFSRAFKAWSGVAPAHYRKQLQGNS